MHRTRRIGRPRRRSDLRQDRAIDDRELFSPIDPVRTESGCDWVVEKRAEAGAVDG